MEKQMNKKEKLYQLFKLMEDDITNKFYIKRSQPDRWEEVEVSPYWAEYEEEGNGVILTLDCGETISMGVDDMNQLIDLFQAVKKVLK